ncbi:putative inorganic phosphate cotransporter isoform X2 [Metopolophium dirhodum]|uniref:putative inorganic phosphate cotransporter isoform X2 n=1 Tax=Metopolophium dirhodum TaxID=44670 RepID=UPI00298FD842|nr:putative inorganic phosphate cotransporter isoform X2 [Metopolophium dirhodum]
MTNLDDKQTEPVNLQEMNSIHKASSSHGIGFRHLQSLLLFLCVVSGYLIRVNLSVTIVAMNPVINSTDYFRELADRVPIFGWTNSQRSVLLSTFFVGYLLANFPASVLGCRFDNKTLLACSMTASSLLTIISPPVVYAYGAPALVAVRFAQGLSSAFMFPMVHGIMSKWAPPHERGQLVGFINSGIQLGTMVTMAVSGVLCSSSMGWPSVYYLSGAFGLAWTAIWLLLGSGSLSTHRFVSQAEMDYIQKSLTNTVDHDRRLSDTPWKSIFTSLPVWATALAHIGHNWGFWLLLTEMPTFIHTVLKFDIKDDGILSSLPYLAMFVLQIPVTFIADFLNKREITSLTVSRKIWNTISMWGGTIGLVILGFIEDTHLTIILYVFIVAIGCTSNAGFNINHMDLSPNYAGLLMGITNTVAASGGIIAPLFVGLVVDDQTSVAEWRIVFISGAIVLFITNLFFIIFGSAETQPWNSLQNKDSLKMDSTKQDIEIVG